MRALAVAVLALAVAAPVARAAAAVSVAVDRTHVKTTLGGDFGFTTMIRTGSPRRVVVHLNVLSLRPGTYVDPEDWSSHRTRYVRGGSIAIRWRLIAVNWGSFAVYVAVLSADGKRLLAVTRPVRVSVARKETLSANGVLPLVFGIPALLALAWTGFRVRRRA
jgi:hypothetical protein